MKGHVNLTLIRPKKSNRNEYTVFHTNRMPPNPHSRLNLVLFFPFLLPLLQHPLINYLFLFSHACFPHHHCENYSKPLFSYSFFIDQLTQLVSARAHQYFYKHIVNSKCCMIIIIIINTKK